MRRCLVSSLISLGLLSGMAQAATLDIPAPQTTVSGIGVISGWKCQANGPLTIRFDGGNAIPLLYGSERGDTRKPDGPCDEANTGFVAIMNWGNLGDGTHTAVVYDDGREFARSRFTVVTTGEAFLTGAGANCVVDDFPRPGDDSTFVWNEATQHMELWQVREWYDEPDPPDLPANADFDFLLDQEFWTIEVPDLLSWQYVSQHENPDWETLNPDNGGRGGNRYVAGPAEVRFIRYIHGGTSNKISHQPAPGITMTGHIQGTIVRGTDRWGDVILAPALGRALELGTLANGLPLQTREAIGELDEGYSLVVVMDARGGTQGNHCYILVFDDFRRTPNGGLETEARFYITARTPYERGAYRYCIPPIYPGGMNGHTVPSVTKPKAVTRLRID